MRRYIVNLYKTQKQDPKNAFQKNVLNFALFPDDNAVTKSIIEGWQYEPHLFHFLEKNLIETTGKTILDVGANNGNFAVDFSMLVGEKGRVHCFEPQRIVYYQLCANVFINGLSNVYCHNVAVGGDIGTVKIGVPDYFAQGPVNFGDVRVSAEGEITKLTPLDSMEYEDVVVIKMDVQGYESHVIDGAVKTIKKHRPYLFIELEDHLLKEMDTSEEQLINKIEALDYKLIRFQEGQLYHTVSGKCIDWVGIPNEMNPENHIIP